MKRIKKVISYFNPKRLIKYKDINIIISICIFVIASFILGGPVGRNKIAIENKILEDYNYQVLKQIPRTSDALNIINQIIDKECKVNDRKVLECSSFNGEYYNVLSFQTEDGITKNIHFVIDIFDISTVYIGKVDPNYEPRERFVIEEIGYQENTEDYLIRFASDSLYFQAHPFGINSKGIRHNGVLLKTEVNQIYYQSLLPDFAIDSENIEPENFGAYLLDQLIVGNQNKIKLKAYTQTFLIGVLFTLITIIILWIFFRKNGFIKKFYEYYNIAAITSIPISVIFFIMLWFIPSIINVYIFVFSLIYVLVLYNINTSEEIV